MIIYSKEKVSVNEALQKVLASFSHLTVLEELLFSINESISCVITDREHVLYANDLFCEAAGYDVTEIVGKELAFLHEHLDKKAFLEEVSPTILSGRIWRGEMQKRAADGEHFWVKSTIVPVVNEMGKAELFFCFQTEIDGEKKSHADSHFKTNFIHTFKSLQNGIFKVQKQPNKLLVYTMSEGKLMDEIGASSREIYEKSPFDIFDNSTAKIKYDYYLRAFKGERVSYELELNGVYIHVALEPIKVNGHVVEVVGTVYDFSAFRDVEKQLKVHEEQYQSLLNYSHEYITTLDRNGKVLNMNAKTMTLFGVNQHTMKTVGVSKMVSKDDFARVNDCFIRTLRGEVQFFEFDVPLENGRTVLNVTLVPIVIDHEIVGVNAIGIDITTEKLVQERNAYLAHHDELTGLPNRRWMEQKIHTVLQQKQSIGCPIALLSLDLDRFKSVNDTLGHFVGDGLLRQFAERLQVLASRHEMDVARMGGDEFMVVCSEVASKEEVIAIADDILNILKEPFYVDGYELIVTASIGIHLHSSDDTNVIEMMKSVDVALYKSKEFGRNMYQVYEHSMESKSYQAFMMERDLRKAIHHDEFVAYFQPKIDARTNEIIGAEALIRWNHPTQGLIPPAQFIPIAEESGLITQIEKWMKRTVCQQLVMWRDLGQKLIPISVNISSNRFLQKEFASEIRELLQEFQLDGQWLEFEITENSIMRNEDTVQKTLRELKEMGVRIFIDDFGTGYSSFNYLKTFELDGVKIDRSFIQNIAQQPVNASITSAMIKMAQHLQLEVIAEGVETEDELAHLHDEGCYMIQGFYYSKPQPIEQFEQRYIFD